MDDNVLLYTDFKDLKLYKRGKVRDVYELEDKLLVVATDRISCFDVVLPTGIPYKGIVLNQLSCFWFDFASKFMSHHLVTSDFNRYPESLKKYKKELMGRSMLVKKTKPLAVECVVRGYLAGSGWKEYLKTQSVCGIKLPSGLVESSRLPEVIFTPSTKEDTGHDRNVDQAYIEQLVGKNYAQRLKTASIEIYKQATDHALKCGIIIADTKFEFGLMDDQIILIDEALTPDSSRFWPKDQYKPGVGQPSFDKQFVRDYLESINWDKNPPAPELPEEIIKKTTQKYLEAFERLSGKKLQVK